MKLAALLLLLPLAATLGGCYSFDPVAYRPDPAIVGAIPPAKAKATAKKQIERALPGTWGQPGYFRAVELDDEGFRLESRLITNPQEEWRAYSFEYDRLDPHLYTMDNRFGVSLEGPTTEDEGMAFQWAHVLWYTNRRDAEILMDALAALRESAPR